MPSHVYRNQVLNSIATLLQVEGKEEEASLRQIAEKYHLSRDHLAQLRDDTWNDIHRDELQVLMSLAAERKLLPLFAVRPNPIWETLDHQPVASFVGADKRGRQRTDDLDVQHRLIQRIGFEPSAGIHDDVVETIRTHNCIFLSSPKYNLACETALAALWGLNPA